MSEKISYKSSESVIFFEGRRFLLVNLFFFWRGESMQGGEGQRERERENLKQISC